MSMAFYSDCSLVVFVDCPGFVGPIGVVETNCDHYHDDQRTKVIEENRDN